MTTYKIRVVNSDFESSNEMDAPGTEEARSQALRSALEIGIDEVCKGNPFFGAEVSIELNGDTEKRFMVGIGQSPLI